MKKIRLLSGCIMAILFIELVVINFHPLYNMVFYKDDTNIKYDMNKAEYVNWRNIKGSWTSLYDPMIIFEDVDRNIDLLRFEVEVDPSFDYADLFFTTKEGEVFTGENMIRDNQIVDGIIEFQLNKNVKDLRLDLGDKSGIKIKKIDLVINPVSVDISFSRIFAMVVIVLVSLGLNLLQKTPKYEV